jgi:hypothetical protein
LEDKRTEVRLHAAAKAQTADTFKQPTPGRGDGGNPDRPTARPDKNLKDKEKREKREKDTTRQHKKPEPEAGADGVHRRADSCNQTSDYMRYRGRWRWREWEKIGASVQTLVWIREGASIPYKNNRPPS